MTDTTRLAPRTGLPMDEDLNVIQRFDQEGHEVLEITSEKTLQKFTVVKTEDGFSHQRVYVNTGKLPNALSGKFSNTGKAVQAIAKYLRELRRDTPGARYKRNHKDGSKVQPDDTVNIQQGTAD